MNASAPLPIHLEDYTVPDYLVDTVNLKFELGETSTTVESTLMMRRNGAHKEPLVLDGADLTLEQVTLDGSELDNTQYVVDAQSLTLRELPEHFCLRLRTVIHPERNTSLDGLYKSSNTFCTQCEAQGFRKITYYLDRPDVMARFTTTLRADKSRYPTLLSNGNQISSGESGDKHWVTWDDPYPKPSYLFGLIAGDLACLEDQFVTASGRSVTLKILVEHHNGKKCAHAMQALKKSMRWDEQVYGLEYDLDIFHVVAVDDFNMGAMENKSLNIFNSKYVLANAATATDDDYAAIEAVIAHEYFHNWTGNRVTLRDWFQLSLKEGLTVFRDQEFSADTFSRPLSRIQNVRTLRTSQFPEDAGPMAHPVRPATYIEINNFYTVTIYNKGAEVIRMMHTLLGVDGFRAGMDLYFKRHDGQAVTTDDFVQAMQDASGIDLTQFRRWYSQAGTPELHMAGEYDPAAQTYTLDVTQTCAPSPGQSTKEPFHIPLAIGLLDGHGNSLPLKRLGSNQTRAQAKTTTILDITQSQSQFTFVEVPEAPVPSVLRDFSAPVKATIQRGAGELGFLSAHDPDPFNRWDAGQDYALQLMLTTIRAHQMGHDWSVDQAFVDAIRRTLLDSALEPGLIGEALILPAETYVAEYLEPIDVEAVHYVREALRKLLATQLEDEFKHVFTSCSSDAPYQFDAQAAGRRKLKNVCLAHLMELDDAQTHEQCLRQFRGADNMTDVLAAFRILTNKESDEREVVLDEFLKRWGDDALVLDKWFTTQATCRLPNTLNRVKELLDHTSFNMANPNKVRSLIGAFCFGNPLHFHAADGSGYDFLTEQVTKLDATNPQVAARLLSVLSRWKRFDPSRQTLMKAALEKIIAMENLSKDAFEIASKSVAE